MSERTAKYLAAVLVAWLFPLAWLSSSEAQPSASASASAVVPALSGSMKPGYSADPPAISTEHQWLISLRYEEGRVTVVGARKIRLPESRVTPRNIGRFAVELLSGPTVIERLRFDFPLIGADERTGGNRAYNSPPRFENHTVVVQQLLLPDTSRASRARLIDRATGRAMMIDWPPVADMDAGRVAQEAGAALSATIDSGAIVDGGADSTIESGADVRASD